MRKLYNFAAFQAAWFVAVWGAAHAHETLGVAAITVVLAIHLWITRDRSGEPLLLLATLPIGFVVNATLNTTGAVTGEGSALAAWLPPPWLLAMWPLFGSLFNESMSWMRGRYAIGVAFGVVGAPLSYLGGVRMGAVHVSDHALHWVALTAVTWGTAMWLVLALQARWTPATTRI